MTRVSTINGTSSRAYGVATFYHFFSLEPKGVHTGVVCMGVETIANVAPIMRNGADWFAAVGTEPSKGSKVFSLIGKVQNAGLIEVPMGMTLREIVFNLVPHNFLTLFS